MSVHAPNVHHSILAQKSQENIFTALLRTAVILITKRLGVTILEMRTHIADGFQRVLLARSEHSQHIGLHVNLHLLIRLQLITQPDIRLARIQLPPALPTSVSVLMLRIPALMTDDDLWSLQHFPGAW